MRVARLHGARDVRLSDEPRARAARAGESLVRVEAVGICGSDLHWFEEGGIGDSRLAAPLVVGHEFAGVVEAGPLAGRRVAVDPAIPCERCDLCREGHPNLCPEVRFAGHGSWDGALRQYLAWPTHRLHPLPDALDGVDGALLEPLGVAIHAVDLGHVDVGDRVAIVGCGPIGLLLAQVCAAAGATVALAVDPLEHRRAAARAPAPRSPSRRTSAVGRAGGRRRVRGGGHRRGRRPRAARRAAGSARRAGRDPVRRSDDVLGVDRATQGRRRSCSSAA